MLVAHGGVMDVLYRVATGQELQSPRTWQLGNAAINRLLWTPQGFTLVGWADTQHLEHAAARRKHLFLRTLKRAGRASRWPPSTRRRWWSTSTPCSAT